MKPKNHHRANEWYVYDKDAMNDLAPSHQKEYPRPEPIEPILDPHELMLQPSHKKQYPSDAKIERRRKK